jgi:Tol biopolymer transport system component
MKRVLLAALLGACTEDATQLVVRVDSDIEELATVRAVVLDDQGAIASEHTFQIPAEVQIPFSFGVAPSEGPPDQMVVIELESVVNRRAVTRFVPNKTMLLPMYLAKSCIGITCEAGQTCTELGCQSENVPVDDLIEIEPGDETRYDGGVVAPDAGVEKSSILVTADAGLRTSESGGTASFSVVLASAPTSFVGIDVSVSDPGEGSIDVDLLTFTPLDWDVPKTVIITGLDDQADDGDRTYTIITAPAVGDAEFEGVDPVDVQVVNEDDDESSILLVGSEGLSTTERGGTASFSILLGSQPSQDVSLRLLSSDTSEGTVSTATIAFTPADWDVPREVMVTGVDDADTDGPVQFTVSLDPSSSIDPAFAALPIQTVTITNADDEAAGVTVSPTAGLLTTEAGETATFMVVLNTQPTGTVSIALSSTDEREAVVGPLVVSFDDQTWSTPQVVTVTGVDDAIDDGDVELTIVTAAALSVDPEYAGIDPADVMVVNQDDEVAGVTVSPLSGLVTTESGDTASFEVRLQSAPTQEVTIAFASSDTSEGTVDTPELRFDGSNWSVPQTVRITGADDAMLDGAVAYTIVSMPAASLDPAYAGLDPPDVSITNADDDSPGITVSPTAVGTAEAGGNATFSVRLTTVPAANVTIALSSSDTTEATVMPAMLTFNTNNWSMPQMVTVSGVDDGIDDGDVVLSIVTAAASSTDPAYLGINPADVTVTNLDNDQAGIIVMPQTGLTTTEAGGTATFMVRLSCEPTTEVVIGLSSNDTTEGTVAPMSLAFGTANWNTARMVTVTGVQDFVDDGNVGYTIVTAPAVSGDPAYSGLNAANVAVTNTDDDTAGVTVMPFSNIITRESGVPASFSMRLDSQPASNVVFTFGAVVAGEVTFNTAPLTFTPGNWNMPQSVAITPLDDNALDGDQPWTIITPAANSLDPQYAGRDPVDVTGTNIDDGFVPPTLLAVDTRLGGTIENPSISADGRSIAFVSDRNDLVPNDFNLSRDVFVFSRANLSITRVSVATNGTEANTHSGASKISADGRWVVFQSGATNLVANDNNGVLDVFLHDRMTGTTSRASVTSAGGEANMPSEHPGISPDGRYLVFHSTFQFEPAPGNRVWRHDRVSGMTNVSGPATDLIFAPGISADGRWVIYEEWSGTVDSRWVRLYDRQMSTLILIGAPPSQDPWITSDGIQLGYAGSDDLNVPNDMNGYLDVFVRDRITGAVELISVSITSAGADGMSDSPSVSDDGRYVVFASTATNLTGFGTLPGRHLYLRDRQAPATLYLLDDVIGAPRISANGRFIATGVNNGQNGSNLYLLSRP